MPNELQSTTPSALDISTGTPVSSVQQTGEKNVYANRVDTMNITIQNAAVVPQLLTQKPQPTAITMSRTHYNLFVTYGADFTQSTPFTVEAARALTEYMDDDLKAEFATLSPDVIERIKSFPCIFANENAGYGHTDEDSQGWYQDIPTNHISTSTAKIERSFIRFGYPWKFIFQRIQSYALEHKENRFNCGVTRIRIPDLRED